MLRVLMYGYYIEPLFDGFAQFLRAKEIQTSQARVSPKLLKPLEDDDEQAWAS